MKDTISNHTSELTGTFADYRGGLVDWSGITAVGVCLECSAQMGPYFTEAECSTALGAHRRASHPEGVNPAIIDAQRAAPCSAEGCASVPHSKGLCSYHKEQALAEHRKINGPWCEWEHGHCGLGVAMGGYCRGHYARHKQARISGNALNTSPLKPLVLQPRPAHTLITPEKPVRLRDTHGTHNCYKAGCRCTLCTDANRVYANEYYQANKHRRKSRAA